jgi:hypothetical protein
LSTNWQLAILDAHTNSSVATLSEQFIPISDDATFFGSLLKTGHSAARVVDSTVSITPLKCIEVSHSLLPSSRRDSFLTREVEDLIRRHRNVAAKNGATQENEFLEHTDEPVTPAKQQRKTTDFDQTPSTRSPLADASNFVC